MMLDNFVVTVARKRRGDFQAGSVFASANVRAVLDGVAALTEMAPEVTCSVWHWPVAGGVCRRILVSEKGRWRVGEDLDATRVALNGKAIAQKVVEVLR